MTRVDWNAVDAMFKFVESPDRPGRPLNGYVASGFVAAAVMIDASGDVEAWWEALLGVAAPADPASALARRGFVENWRDVEARFGRGRFAPPVPGPNEPGHEEALVDFCDGLLQVIDASAAALALLARSPAATRAAATLRRRVMARSTEAAGRASGIALVADALHVLWRATAGLRIREVARVPLRAA